MGEAKRRIEQIRQKHLRLVDEWARPATPEEAALVKEISLLPVSTVPVADAKFFAQTRMEPQECHANCYFLQENDPEKLTRVISGWVLIDDCYVLHSIVNQRGNIFCATPNATGESSIKFIPDDDIIYEGVEDGKYIHRRREVKILYGLRINPEKTIEYATQVRERLLSGMNPYEAMKFPN